VVAAKPSAAKRSRAAPSSCSVVACVRSNCVRPVLLEDTGIPKAYRGSVSWQRRACGCRSAERGGRASTFRLFFEICASPAGRGRDPKPEKPGAACGRHHSAATGKRALREIPAYVLAVCDTGCFGDRRALRHEWKGRAHGNRDSNAGLSNSRCGTARQVRAAVGEPRVGAHPRDRRG
jgi:hypothetical protein